MDDGGQTEEEESCLTERGPRSVDLDRAEVPCSPIITKALF